MSEEWKEVLWEIQCPRCRTKYPRPEVGTYSCSICRFHERMDCAWVRSCYENFKNITMEEVINFTGVEPKRIERIKKELKIEMNVLENGKNTCQKCGAFIPYGRFCEDCKIDIGYKIKNAETRSTFLKNLESK